MPRPVARDSATAASPSRGAGVTSPGAVTRAAAAAAAADRNSYRAAGYDVAHASTLNKYGAAASAARPVTRGEGGEQVRRKVLYKRFKDTVWFVYFLTHIAAMLLVDLVALYPEDLVPRKLWEIRAYYIDNYQDQYFTATPHFFTAFLWMEALFQLPTCIWALWALWTENPRVPIVCLIYAVQTAVTTATCIFDMRNWTAADEVKAQLLGLYAPYLAVAVLMGYDMYSRLVKLIGFETVYTTPAAVKSKRT